MLWEDKSLPRSLDQQKLVGTLVEIKQNQKKYYFLTTT